MMKNYFVAEPEMIYHEMVDDNSFHRERNGSKSFYNKLTNYMRHDGLHRAV